MTLNIGRTTQEVAQIGGCSWASLRPSPQRWVVQARRIRLRTVVIVSARSKKALRTALVAAGEAVEGVLPGLRALDNCVFRGGLGV